MEKLDKGLVSRGGIKFWAISIAVLALEAVHIFLDGWMLNAVIIKDYLIYLLGVSLLVGVFGAARGASYQRYLLVFFVVLVLAKAGLMLYGYLGMAEGMPLNSFVIVLFLLSILIDLAYLYILLLDRSAHAWFTYQYARNFGGRVAMTGGHQQVPDKQAVDVQQLPTKPLSGKDELGIFDEED